MGFGRRILAIVLAVFLLLLATGVALAAETNKRIVVGFAISSLERSFETEMKRGSEDAAKEWNFDVVCEGAHGSAETQKAIVEKFVADKVSAILVDPIDPAMLTPAVKAAIKAGIPVVTLGPTTVADPAVVHVDTNNRLVGRKGFELISSRLSGDAVVLVLALKGSDQGKDRTGGFDTALQAQARIKIAGVVEASDRAQATTVVEQAIKDKGAVQAIFAENEELAIGAVKALNVLSPSAQVIVVGVGNNNETAKMLRLGSKLVATVLEKPWDMGHIGTETALRILKGGKPAKFIPVDVVTFPAGN